MSEEVASQENCISLEDIRSSVGASGLEFNESDYQPIHEDIDDLLASYEELRSVSLPNSVPPAFRFVPEPFFVENRSDNSPAAVPAFAAVKVPADLEEVAFWPVTQLAELMRTRQVSSRALTEMYLARLKRYDPVLKCVIALTEELAFQQAERADAELMAGHYRGPLHGIPWGAKDLLAAKGYPTTWGAMPYKDQTIDSDATVVSRLEQSGAVLVAKLAMGALAWGDVWFGGTTKSPWNIELGSSGSSAGPGAATAAGLVGFAIGTETWGSIISPSTRCGVTGLRPTFGRVSRHGAMALSWTMDKIGPMCRSAQDCALVFDAIQGRDPHDPTTVSRPFVWPSDIDLTKLRIGYLARAFEEDYPARENDQDTLATLGDLGADLIPIELPDYPVEALSFILTAEAAAAFDDLTRSGDDALLVRQTKDAWPHVFRLAHLIPAVEYIQANRVRTLIIQAMAALMEDVDLYVAPSLVGHNLLLTNLTGHPAVVVPNGMGEDGTPTSTTFSGKLFDEATVLAVANVYQDATGFHHIQPAFTA